MIKLDKATTKRLLDEAVAARGEDYVYEQPIADWCVYTYDGKPSCIVGHVLDAAGIPLEELERGDAGYWGAGRLVENLENKGLLETDYGTRQALIGAQWRQDDGDTWGEAVNSVTRLYLA